MQHKFPPLPVRIAVIAIVLGGLAYLGYQTLTQSSNGHIAASGSIEATIVNVSPEMAGKVKEVLAQDGQTVNVNDALLSLDGSLLAAQRAVAAAQAESAQAALTSAQTRYDQALQAALAAQEAQRAKDWRISSPDEFDQPLWYIAQPEEILAAQAEADAAQAALDAARANLQQAIQDLNNADYLAAETRLAQARAAFLVADKVKVQAENAVEGGGLQNAAYDYYNQAKDELDAAQKAFNGLTNTKAEGDVQYARGKLAVAQQRYDAAYARLLSLQSGAYAPAVVAAKDALAQAQAALAQAQTNVDLLDIQISKLQVSAPIGGVILTRNIEPGEFVQPGAVALTMADLSNITITVYVPENLYGKISLGQTAEVRVDSFPGESFSAAVIQISNQAEFTPRNVQTAEGRSSTFYAIKLRVDNPEGRLKIGMPADVIFVQ
ncbi:MAG: efflux RND transporter periplasmic adaptor subunit [Anaerolineales bacterium]